MKNCLNPIESFCTVCIKFVAAIPSLNQEIFSSSQQYAKAWFTLANETTTMQYDNDRNDFEMTV